MQRSWIFAVVAVLLVLTAIWFLQSGNPKTEYGVKHSEATDTAGRSPASAPRPGVPVVRVTEDNGKDTIKLAFEQKIELQMQRKEDLLNQYRLGPMPPLPGAGTFEMMRLKAVPKAAYEPRMGQLISEKLGFAIFASTQSMYSLSAEHGLPVVANKSNGMLGIVTGTIIVTLKESGLAASIAQSYDLTLKYLDKDLRIAYFTAPANTQLERVVEALQRDGSIESVDLEIVQSRKRL